MNFPCSIKEQDAQPFLAVRLRTPVTELPARLGESYGAIMAHLDSLGQQPAGIPFSASYNQDMNDLDVEIGIPTAEILPGSGDIYGSEIPAGRVAECVFTGSYNKMEPAYQALAEFVAEQGEEATGIAYEIYIDDPGEVPVSERRTLIVFPLK
ncbi:MAG: GyrI-like domain-containing protein [Candidatus Promineifilaceae bacterium]|nr:GyrI-like domain-containing protein [Candidatus Promineifilaceae bacterium]